MTPRWFAVRLALSLAVVLLAVAPARAGDFDRGVLWLLEPPDGGRPSFLLGTMHVADPRVIEVEAPVDTALGASRIAVFEVIDDPATQGALAQAMMLGGGQTLDAILPPRLWDAVQRVGAAYGLLPMVTRLMKPWALIAMFSMPVEQMRRLTGGGEAFDIALQDRARARGLPLEGLETAEEQIAVFESLTLEEQIALLDDLLANKAENDAMFEELIVRYTRQDLAGIADLADSAAGAANADAYESFMEAMKTRRDALMFERLQPIVTEGGAFVAVGALHLTGETGLLQRFADAGWHVRPLK